MSVPQWRRGSVSPVAQRGGTATVNPPRVIACPESLDSSPPAAPADPVNYLSVHGISGPYPADAGRVAAQVPADEGRDDTGPHGLATLATALLPPWCRGRESNPQAGCPAADFSPGHTVRRRPLRTVSRSDGLGGPPRNPPLSCGVATGRPNGPGRREDEHKDSLPTRQSGLWHIRLSDARDVRRRRSPRARRDPGRIPAHRGRRSRSSGRRVRRSSGAASSCGEIGTRCARSRRTDCDASKLPGAPVIPTPSATQSSRSRCHQDPGTMPRGRQAHRRSN